MARIWADRQFDQGNLDLSRITDGFVQNQILDNANTRVHGITYTDAYAPVYLNGGYYFQDAFLGPSITVNLSTQAITGGTITGYAEAIFINNALTFVWGVENTSASALSLYKAAFTASTADDYAVINAMLVGADTFDLSGFDDTAYGFGGNDTMSGGAGSDMLFGGIGNDSLIGGSGNDELFGDAGVDRLSGGLGNDILTGGTGADILTGGSGRDNFIFNAIDAVDVITDFAHGIDHISLSRSAMGALNAPGALKKVAFWSADGATHGHDSSDRIIYNSTTGDLYFDADGSLGGAAIKIAVLTPGLHLTNADFFVI